MTPTSATGGYLTPGGPAPPEDDAALDALLQTMLSGICGLPDDAVGLLWSPSTQPSDIDHCAFAVLAIRPDSAPSVIHDGEGEGVDVYQRHMDLDVLVSFFGPNARRYGQVLSNGLHITQNAEALRAERMTFVGASALTTTAPPVNEQWVRRYDLTLQLRRQVVCTYQVLNLLSADTSVTAD